MAISNTSPRPSNRNPLCGFSKYYTTSYAPSFYLVSTYLVTAHLLKEYFGIQNCTSHTSKEYSLKIQNSLKKLSPEEYIKGDNSKDISNYFVSSLVSNR